MTDWLTPTVITALVGGLATAIGIIVKGRVDLRKTKLDEDRQPVEIENIFIGGAEKAVAALQVALDRAEATISRLEKSLTERDEKLQERDRKIAELEADITNTLARLARLQERCEQLTTRLAELRSDPREGDTI
ncbi:hypothetical protein [Nonomuraea typhae]|uniref:DUF2746 domain-containing protein n=1 Tax=Nonomuraea typhae TaxID=2603600 RepID=A0ABW7YMG5_9ACTN